MSYNDNAARTFARTNLPKTHLIALSFQNLDLLFYKRALCIKSRDSVSAHKSIPRPRIPVPWVISEHLWLELKNLYILADILTLLQGSTLWPPGREEPRPKSHTYTASVLEMQRTLDSIALYSAWAQLVCRSITGVKHIHALQSPLYYGACCFFNFRDSNNDHAVGFPISTPEGR